MRNIIQHRRTDKPGVIIDDLAEGEFGLNTADGVLFWNDADGNVCQTSLTAEVSDEMAIHLRQWAVQQAIGLFTDNTVDHMVPYGLQVAAQADYLYQYVVGGLDFEYQKENLDGEEYYSEK